jgi:hypothetical protein
MPGVYQLLTGLHNSAGNFFSNVWHYQLTEAGSGSPFDYANALIDGWKAAVEVDYLNLMGNDVVLDFLQCKKVDGAKGPSATQISGDTGTGPAESISSQLAADVAWITASALNRFGRTFIGGIYNGSFSQDLFAPTFLVKVAAYVLAMKTAITLAGALGSATFGIWTKKTSTFNVAKEGQIQQKATTMNKRARPRV